MSEMIQEILQTVDLIIKRLDGGKSRYVLRGRANSKMLSPSSCR